MKHKWLPIVISVLVVTVLACRQSAPQAPAETPTPAPTLTLIGPEAFNSPTPFVVGTETPRQTVVSTEGVPMTVTLTPTISPNQQAQLDELLNLLKDIPSYEADGVSITREALFEWLSFGIKRSVVDLPTIEWCGPDYRGYHAEGHNKWPTFCIDPDSKQERLSLYYFLQSIVTNNPAHPDVWLITDSVNGNGDFVWEQLHPSNFQFPPDNVRVRGFFYWPTGGPKQ